MDHDVTRDAHPQQDEQDHDRILLACGGPQHTGVLREGDRPRAFGDEGRGVQWG